MTFIGFLRWFFGWDRDRHKHCPQPLDIDEWERIKREGAPTWPVQDRREPHLESDRRVEESYCAGGWQIFDFTTGSVYTQPAEWNPNTMSIRFFEDPPGNWWPDNWRPGDPL